MNLLKYAWIWLFSEEGELTVKKDDYMLKCDIERAKHTMVIVHNDINRYNNEILMLFEKKLNENIFFQIEIFTKKQVENKKLKELVINFGYRFVINQLPSDSSSSIANMRIIDNKDSYLSNKRETTYSWSFEDNDKTRIDRKSYYRTCKNNVITKSIETTKEEIDLIMRCDEKEVNIDEETYYGKILVDPDRFDDLILREQKLIALENLNVETWEHYTEAMFALDLNTRNIKLFNEVREKMKNEIISLTNLELDNIKINYSLKKILQDFVEEYNKINKDK